MVRGLPSFFHWTIMGKRRLPWAENPESTARVVDATRIRKGDLVFLPKEPEGCKTTRTHFEPATIGRYGVSVGHTYRADNLERIVRDKITNRSGVDTVYLVTSVEETRHRGLPSNVYDLMSNSTSARPAAADPEVHGLPCRKSDRCRGWARLRVVPKP